MLTVGIGPGAYDIKGFIGTGLKKSIAARFDVHTSNESTPGPGAYDKFGRNVGADQAHHYTMRPKTKLIDPAALSPGMLLCCLLVVLPSCMELFRSFFMRALPLHGQVPERTRRA